MIQRTKIAATALTLLFFVPFLFVSSVQWVPTLSAQETVPGKIIPDLDQDSSDDAGVENGEIENDSGDDLPIEADAEKTLPVGQSDDDQDDNENVDADDEGDEGDEESNDDSLDEDDEADDESRVSTDVSIEFMDAGDVPESVEQLVAMQEHVAEMAERCKPATVNIMCQGAQGSGVVVSRDGYILTAAHVISKPRINCTVTFPDGTEVNARTLGVHHSNIDSGMLKIVDEGRWPYLDLGESETLTQGQWVFAIGHPGGMDKDRGLVVRVGRLIGIDDTVLRSDCTLVGGDSGGPLFDMAGNVIGIHSRIGGTLVDNFHVPVDIFSDEWDDLAAGRRIGVPVRPFIGLGLVDETNEIDHVDEDGPAEKAGLKSGDIVIKAGDRDVEDKTGLRTAMRNVKPDDKLIVIVERDDEELEFEIKVGEK